MTGFADFWNQGDAVIRAVAALLLLMSLGAWVVIFWKSWMLQRARRSLARALPAFWVASDLAAGRIALDSFDTEAVLQPLLDATTAQTQTASLDGSVKRESRLTRRLRDALHMVVRRLQYGQVFLASIGSTAPFIGLFGTVWGIYHALVSISAGGNLTIEKISGPVGEALIMTAAGLAVAIPAVLAYNIFGKLVGDCEAELEGFAHDLREMLDQEDRG
ncbi:MotA/TolQ/ExbB proton channel family protein [Paucibacter sp. Y2R2-4]|uniref:MotA/TolQ/ExbB proton channel family protein n=1 Tax=Paucibacter sp. Y2R2-4 TaxID=2893553 RepID=UPI0021E35EDF|nr:MotA/TolQ/ExbB proton channel family protein [Paucibacter sp. Y2R2-4]MCV2351309.1 MotA/TolQ/ExbB proton channel family protein [Paucibacter sp. Y2R2-4]